MVWILYENNFDFKKFCEEQLMVVYLKDHV